MRGYTVDGCTADPTTVLSDHVLKLLRAIVTTLGYRHGLLPAVRVERFVGRRVA